MGKCQAGQGLRGQAGGVAFLGGVTDSCAGGVAGGRSCEELGEQPCGDPGKGLPSGGRAHPRPRGGLSVRRTEAEGERVGARHPGLWGDRGPQTPVRTPELTHVTWKSIREVYSVQEPDLPCVV